jgi:hypothetical protein
MEISKTAVGVLAALCITAGAGGAYLATRGGEPSPVNATAPAISPDPSAAWVEESEAIVVDDVVRDVGMHVGMDTAPAAAAPRQAAAAPPRVEAPRQTAAPRPARPAPQAAATRPSYTAPDREPASAPAPIVENRIAVPPAVEAVRTTEPEPVRPLDPPAPEFEELIVSADSVVGLQVETAITSERAEVEDEVVARVTRDVRVGDRVAIPAGSTAHGEVTLVERGGRLRERARLGVRFTSVVLADGTRVPIETDTVYREGDAPGRESAAKIGGGAIGGAIIGGILGGAKGAILGGTAGAGAGSAAVLAGGRNPATLPTGTPITVRVMKPAAVTVHK